MKILSTLLAKPIAEVPNKKAVFSKTTSYSFVELEAISNALAKQLISEFDIKKGDRVAVLTRKSTEIVVAIMAIWKAGGIYVPIDYKNGEERLQYILEDVDAKMVISAADTIAKFENVLKVYHHIYFSIQIYVIRIKIVSVKKSVWFDEKSDTFFTCRKI